MRWEERIDGRLDAIAADGRWRSIRPLDGPGPDFILDGRPVVSFPVERLPRPDTVEQVDQLVAALAALP